MVSSLKRKFHTFHSSHCLTLSPFNSVCVCVCVCVCTVVGMGSALAENIVITNDDSTEYGQKLLCCMGYHDKCGEIIT